MAGKFTLKVLTDFASAHSLRDYPGDCANLHGHNWKVEVEVASTELDELGMVMDFKKIKGAARELCGQLDHKYLNEIQPFDTINPTAENIAAYLFRSLAERLNDHRVQVCAVTVWETDRACARYSED